MIIEHHHHSESHKEEKLPERIAKGTLSEKQHLEPEETNNLQDQNSHQLGVIILLQTLDTHHQTQDCHPKIR